jgi:DNA-binding transcriptional regulator YbjK
MSVEASTPGRRTSIVDAAIEVLATEGGRGLTHRAIDRRLGLPLGSTANYFGTRTALLRAVNERLLELDIVPLMLTSDRKMSRERAAAHLASVVEGLSGTPEGRSHYIAHHEVLLQSARDHQLRCEIAEARRRFVVAVAQVLTAMGCSKPSEHAPGLVALIDGLTVSQLLYADGPADVDGFKAQFKHHLAQC